ncbi:MAG: hypothetical protein F9K32_05525 [Desulfobulbaceae bacterium]|nr:MAG: hypothetical protein F9K32_05525 [Desulfobulbaceae bacterium]
MKTTARLAALVMALTTAFALACSRNEGEPEVIGMFPVDDLEGLITRSGVEIDRGISSDGKGSLRMATTAPVTVKLYETGDIHLEDSRLTYQARVRTEGVEGQVYLEMWCSFPGKGEFFSRALDAPLSGSNEWSTMQTPFFLEKGENPDNVKLNLVIDGRGTVWIDDIKLIMAPLGK